MAISPYTPVGSLVVCIDDCGDYSIVPSLPRDDPLDGLKKGKVYTVASMVPTLEVASGFVVVLEEIRRAFAVEPDEHGYDLSRFELVVLRPTVRKVNATA